MKKALICAMLMASSVIGARASESTNDSLYLFSYASDNINGNGGLRLAWSSDGKMWHKIGGGYDFVKSD